MFIRKIEILNLFDKNQNKSWEIKKGLYLYGYNGIGKTTLLDSIYIALTNNEKILISQNRIGEQKIRKLEFSKLIISFDNKEDIEIEGSYYLDKPIEIYKIANDYLNNELFYFNEKREILLSNLIGIQKFIDQNNIEEVKNMQEFFNYLQNHQNKIEHKIEQSTIYSEMMRYYNTLKDLITNLRNYYTASNRKKYIDKIDVLYLSIERAKPPLISGYNRSYINEEKAYITPSISKILKAFELELNNFNKSLHIFSRDALNKMISSELKGDCGKDFVSKKELTETQKNIINFSLLSLGYKKDNVENIILYYKDKNKKAIDLLINEIIKEDNNNLFISIVKMNIFIKKSNEYFKDNNKIIKWNYDSMLMEISDNNGNVNIPISDYFFSAGERQIITILFNLCFHKKENLLIVIDEPELSLSIDWQEKLYNDIKSFENTQVIATTHSPFTVTEEDYPISMKAF